MKSRYWTIIIYPDSVNPDYISVLKEKQIKCAISPLHDKDINENGELKKPHRHILLIYNGPVTKNNVLENIVKPINRLEQFQNIIDKEKAFEYLWHENEVDKHKYSKADVIYINSDISDYINSLYISILDYIDDNNIKTLTSLLKKLRSENKRALIKYVSDNTYFVNTYILETRKRYDEKVETLIKNLYNNYRDVYVNKDVLNKLCGVFDEIKITE